MQVERIAHRGAKRECPENSLPAFARAFELGATGIELDVHATADGVVVVHHDPDVGALRSIGRSTQVRDVEWDELRRVELAPGVGIPRLADVLALAPPHATVYVEIKGSAIEHAVASVIHDGAARCAVHSFEHAAIARMREIAPEIPRGLLFESLDRDGSGIEAAVRAARARDVWPQWKLIDAALVVRAHALGARVIAWTVNSAADARRLASLGVDGLCGDDVRLFDGA